MNTTTLAYMGDAVYELQIRELLIGRNKGDVGKVHKRAIAYILALLISILSVTAIKI